MALTSATSTISSAGIGSGLDVNSIVTQLMAVERQPLTRLQTAASSMQTQLSAFGQIQSLVSALQDAARPLTQADSYARTSSSSSDPASVSLATTTKAVPGVYSVSVASLSAAQSAVSLTGQFADAAAAVGTGSLTIRLGAWSTDQTAFTPKAGSADITIAIGATDNTLAGIRDKINAANAGVTATIVTDASGARLAIQSSATGTQNGFRVVAADDDGNGSDALGLSRLAFDPAGGSTGLTRAQGAADTSATINGIAITSNSNTLSDVVDGMTFTLGKVTTQPVSVNVSRNTDAIKTMLTSFVAAYNALDGTLKQATKYDAATKQAALLQGDSTAVGLQSQLHAMLSQTSAASSVFGSLSSLGLQIQKDGSLKLDDAAIANALTKLPELTKALSTVDADTPANNGFGKRFLTLTEGLLSSAGTLPGKTKSIQARITANQKSQDALSDRLAALEKRMRAQYSALDTTVAKANALSKYVNQQFYFDNNKNDNN